MRFRLTFAVGVLVTGLVAWTAAQKPSLDYTQWRGQNRDGSASSLAEPKTWPEALTQRWRADVGLGYATPLVVGDRLYVSQSCPLAAAFASVQGTGAISAAQAATIRSK